MILNDVWAKVSAFRAGWVKGSSEPKRQKSSDPSNKSLSKACEPASLVSSCSINPVAINLETILGKK